MPVFLAMRAEAPLRASQETPAFPFSATIRSRTRAELCVCNNYLSVTKVNCTLI